MPVELRGSPARFDLRKVVYGAQHPVVVADARDRVEMWNLAAATLFGLDEEEILGRSWFDAADARDPFGNRLARDADFIEAMTRSGEPTWCFEISVQGHKGDRVRLAVFLVVVLGPMSGACRFVYHLRPVLRRRRSDEIVERLLTGSATSEGTSRPQPVDVLPLPHKLTPRELEVLRLLAGANTTPQVAAVLGISPTTVRNHTQRILRKLGVHSRVEAVVMAHRHRLI